MMGVPCRALVHLLALECLKHFGRSAESKNIASASDRGKLIQKVGMSFPRFAAPFRPLRQPKKFAGVQMGSEGDFSDLK